MRKSWFLKAVTSVWGLILLILIPCLYIMTTTVVDAFKKLEEADKEAELAAIAAGSKPANDPLAGLSKSDIETLKKQMLDEMLNKGKK